MEKRNFEIERNLSITLDIGEKMLEYGADVSRTEDTVSRLCNMLGVNKFEVYCIGSLLQVYVVMPDGETVQQMRRISNMGNDLARLEELNDISRKIWMAGNILSRISSRISTLTCCAASIISVI